jgi:hypothetical protein
MLLIDPNARDTAVLLEYHVGDLLNSNGDMINARTGIEALDTSIPSLCVVDIDAVSISNLTTWREQNNKPDTQFVFMSEWPFMAREASMFGAAFLLKPLLAGEVRTLFEGLTAQIFNNRPENVCVS